METHFTTLYEAFAKTRRPIMEKLVFNFSDLVISFWDFCVYDVFLVRLVVGLTIVVGVPYYLSEIMNKQNMYDEYYTETELDEISETTRSEYEIKCSIFTELVHFSRIFTINSCWHVFCFPFGIYFWDFCVYDVFLVRLVVGLTIVVGLPYYLSEIMNKQNTYDEYYTEMELETKLDETSETTRSEYEIECTICTESVHFSRIFTINSCCHIFCSSCMGNYIASKLHENIVKIKCPSLNCNKFLDPEECKGLIPSYLFDRWGVALCEMTLGDKKFYCPFQDCSLLLINDGDARARKITYSKCPKCRRFFCAQCKVPWHTKMVCAEYQNSRMSKKEEENQRKLRELAARKKWQQCPNCTIYVERTYGCKLIKCRCGYRFCYTCGAYMRSHNCDKCLTAAPARQ